jgi:hypothetical protein
VKPALRAYAAYLRSETDQQYQERWGAMPRALRVRLCWSCGWLDAVWEACPPLGRLLDRMMHGGA